MPIRKRLAAAMLNSEAVILKRPVQASENRQTEYKQRMRSVCSAIELPVTKLLRCNMKVVGTAKSASGLQPELAAEA